MKRFIAWSCALVGCAGGVALGAEHNSGLQGFVVTSSSKATSAMADQHFLSQAITCGRREIQVSRLALTQPGLPEDVRVVARTVIDGQSRLDAILIRLGRAKDYYVPESADSDGARILSQLEQDRGNRLAFLKGYDRFLERSHQVMVERYEDIGAHTADQDLRTLVSDAMPMLSGHLAMAGQLPYAQQASDPMQVW